MTKKENKILRKVNLNKEAYSVESQSASAEMDFVLLRIMFEEIVCKIEKEHPLYGSILRLTAEGKTQKEIAKILGMTQSAIQAQQEAAIKLFRKLYKEEM